MKLKRGSFVFTSYLIFAVTVSSAWAIPPPPPEYGLRGLRRVELVFMNVGRGGIAGGVARTDGVIPPVPPMEDLVAHVLAKDKERTAIGPTLAREGLGVVEHCRSDDLACAKLYLTVEDHSRDRNDERIYLIAIELSQRVQLARDPEVDLSVPTTWSMHRVAVVASDHSATKTSCIQLRDMATWFATAWKVGNR